MQGMDQVVSVSVSLEGKEADIKLKDAASSSAIVTAIAELGFEAKLK